MIGYSRKSVESFMAHWNHEQERLAEVARRYAGMYPDGIPTYGRAHYRTHLEIAGKPPTFGTRPCQSLFTAPESEVRAHAQRVVAWNRSHGRNFSVEDTWGMTDEDLDTWFRTF